MLAIDKTNGTHEAAKTLQGKCVEIPVHYDRWMQGARFGQVVGHSVAKRCIYVRLDNTVLRRRLKVWYADLSFVKILD